MQDNESKPKTPEEIAREIGELYPFHVLGKPNVSQGLITDITQALTEERKKREEFEEMARDWGLAHHAIRLVFGLAQYKRGKDGKYLPLTKLVQLAYAKAKRMEKAIKTVAGPMEHAYLEIPGIGTNCGPACDKCILETALKDEGGDHETQNRRNS